MPELLLSPAHEIRADQLGLDIALNKETLSEFAQRLNARQVPQQARLFLSTLSETLVVGETEPSRIPRWGPTRKHDDVLAIVPLPLPIPEHTPQAFEGAIHNVLVEAVLHHRNYNLADIQDVRRTKQAKGIGWLALGGGTAAVLMGGLVWHEGVIVGAGYLAFALGVASTAWAFNHPRPERTIPKLDDIPRVIRVTGRGEE